MGIPNFVAKIMEAVKPDNLSNDGVAIASKDVNASNLVLGKNGCHSIELEVDKRTEETDKENEIVPETKILHGYGFCKAS